MPGGPSPTVQRLVGDPPVVAPAAPFAEALATRQPAGLALAPLGHEVSSLATPGLLIGLAAPAGRAAAAAVSGRADLPLQRRADAGTPAEPAWSAFEAAPEFSAPGPADRLGPLNPVPAPVASIQRLAAPAPLLTTAAATGVGTAPAGRLDLRPQAVAPAPPAAQAELLPVVQRAATTAMHGNDRADATELLPPAPAAAPARRPTLGEARRLGLGAPLRSAAEMNVQRSEGGLPGGFPPRAPGVPASPTGALSVQAPANGGAVVAGTPPEAGARAGAASAPVADGAADPGAPGPLELTVVQPLSVERLPSFPVLDRQRAIAAGAPEAGLSALQPGPDEAPGSTSPDPSAGSFPLAISRSASHAAIEPLASGEGGAAAGSPLRRAPVGGTAIRASSSGWLLRQPAARPPTPGHEPGPTSPSSGSPVVSRAFDGGARGSGGARPPMAAQHPMAAQLAALGITVHGELAGPVAQRRSASEGSPAEPGSSPSAGATVVPLQRAVEIPEMQVTSSNAGSAGSAAGSASASPNGAGDPSPATTRADRERELDELARRLYGRIRTRLASELLADRERAGLLVDLR